MTPEVTISRKKKIKIFTILRLQKKDALGGLRKNRLDFWNLHIQTLLKMFGCKFAIDILIYKFHHKIRQFFKIIVNI